MVFCEKASYELEDGTTKAVWSTIDEAANEAQL